MRLAHTKTHHCSRPGGGRSRLIEEDFHLGGGEAGDVHIEVQIDERMPVQSPAPREVQGFGFA
jgi:hypothetical protein